MVVIPAAASPAFKPPADLRQAQEEAARAFDLPGPSEGGYTLFVSTLEPRKNLATLLEAYRMMINRKIVSPVPCWRSPGGRAGFSSRLTGASRNSILRSTFACWAGIQDGSLAKLYQGARLFALPSLYEGFGLPALEALACGVPVLASSGGSLPEVVGEAGLLLEPTDPDAWAAAMERVLTDPGEESRLHALGPEQAANFSWHKAAVQTWHLYEKIARQR